LKGSYNGRVKILPDGSITEIMVCSTDCFIDPTERSPLLAAVRSQKARDILAADRRRIQEAEDASAALGDLWEAQDRRKSNRPKARARKRIFDIVASNQWDFFVTLTLDESLIGDRSDYGTIVKKLNTWLDNAVRRKGLRYIIVPEWHANHKGIHFHGLINDNVFHLVDSGHIDKKGHTIYNIPEWKYGFTTAIKTYGDVTHTAKYVCKYITKQSEKIGGRYFLHGGKMQQPSYKYFNTDFYRYNTERMFEYESDLPGMKFKIERF
jgi:hypothetical protein